MEYKNIKKAKFISRPNRFIAKIEIAGKKEICHVKNTGRCKELLLPGATLFVQEVNNIGRRTKYDLIGVYKGKKLINIDSQAPNKIFQEWVTNSNLFLFKNIEYIKPEFRHGDSHYDFYLKTVTSEIFVEVKGVTLEKNGVALFPDAPTERGIKHINGLSRLIKDGYEAYLVFIIQMKGVLYFTPNYQTHFAFGEALKNAEKQGVKIIALDCEVTADSITARNPVEVRFYSSFL